MHVTLRMNGGAGLRQGRAYRALRLVLTALLGDESFRVVHISIQNNHLHLLVEAANKVALSRGMQRFSIRAARSLQRAFGWYGKVFPWRYHATQIKTPRQARNSLAYVLNNWRRHREDVASQHIVGVKVDPYSSGLSFDGWIGRPRFRAPADYVPLPVSAAQTDLLRFEWKRHGLIDLFERPGPVAFIDQRW